jgi:hypothetical protein
MRLPKGSPTVATLIPPPGLHDRSALNKVSNRLFDVRRTPECHGPAGTRRCCLHVRIQAELVTLDIEADVERFVEVRLNFESR